MKLIFYVFRTVPLAIIRSFSLYTQQWYMSYRFVDSLQAGSVWYSSFILILLAAFSKPVCAAVSKPLTYTIVVCAVKNS